MSRLVLQVYDEVDRRYVGDEDSHGKAFGRGLTPSQVPDALAVFFLRRRGVSDEGGAASLARTRLDFFIERVERLLGWFEGQSLLSFWASSLLFVDGPEGAEVRMIDFAHVVWHEGDGGRDEGYIYGLRTLLAILTALKEKVS